MISYASRQQKQKESNQLNLFDSRGPIQNVVSHKIELIKNKEDIDTKVYLSWERELLGIYLSRHPLSDISDYLANKCIPISQIKNMANDAKVTVGGLISDNKEITTKNGQRMAFLKIEDLTADIEMVVFPKVYKDLADQLIRDKIYLFHSTVSSRSSNVNNNSKSLILENIEPLDLTKISNSNGSNKDPKVYIKLKNNIDDRLLTNLKTTIDKYIGQAKVILVFENNNDRQAIRLPNGFDHQNTEGINILSELVGSENLAVS